MKMQGCIYNSLKYMQPCNRMNLWDTELFHADFLTEIDECRQETREQCQANKEHESPEVIACRTDDDTYDNRYDCAAGIAEHVHDAADSTAVLTVCTQRRQGPVDTADEFFKKHGYGNEGNGHIDIGRRR